MNIKKEEARKIIDFYKSEILRFEKELNDIHNLENDVKYQGVCECIFKEGSKTIAKYKEYIAELEKVISIPSYVVNPKYVYMILQDYQEQKEYLKGTGVNPVNEEVVKQISRVI